MQISEIITILQNRLLTLNQLMAQCISAGDLEQVMRVDADIQTTTISLKLLGALPQDSVDNSAT